MRLTGNTAGRELDRPAAPDEVSDDERDDNKNDRERQKPGPPAVSCEEHINLLLLGLGPITKRGHVLQYLPKAEKREALLPEQHGVLKLYARPFV